MATLSLFIGKFYFLFFFVCFGDVVEKKEKQQKWPKIPYRLSSASFRLIVRLVIISEIETIRELLTNFSLKRTLSNKFITLTITLQIARSYPCCLNSNAVQIWMKFNFIFLSKKIFLLSQCFNFNFNQWNLIRLFLIAMQHLMENLSGIVFIVVRPNTAEHNNNIE